MKNKQRKGQPFEELAESLLGKKDAEELLAKEPGQINLEMEDDDEHIVYPDFIKMCNDLAKKSKKHQAHH